MDMRGPLRLTRLAYHPLMRTGSRGIEWPDGELCSYRARLEECFPLGGPSQALELYASDFLCGNKEEALGGAKDPFLGAIDCERFCDDLGVEDSSHRQLFKAWFLELPPSSAPSGAGSSEGHVVLVPDLQPVDSATDSAMDSAGPEKLETPAAPPQADELFAVEVDRSDGTSLGLDVNYADGQTLLVRSVDGGLFAAWNSSRPAMRVGPGDRIIAVNGRSGDAAALMDECRQRHRLCLTLQRPPEAYFGGGTAGTVQYWDCGEALENSETPEAPSGNDEVVVAVGLPPMFFLGGTTQDARKLEPALLALVEVGSARSEGSMPRRTIVGMAGLVALGALRGGTLPVQATEGGEEGYGSLIERYKPDHPPVRSTSSEADIALARHLTKVGAACYSTWWCPHCQEQREEFGKEAVALAPFVECSSASRKQLPICKEKGDDIPGYPTWIYGGKVFRGGKELSELAKMTGFSEYPAAAFKKREGKDLEYIWGRGIDDAD
ncbi:unnamed protein product [Polarella glacialis]|uniref:PDZ domain-containing protein n=1 Tax=Polarella glacialis TaxID=89957 RepID=A0A813FCY0_POLGL|nr:unnamed protein product [Polarella glacialis]